MFKKHWDKIILVFIVILAAAVRLYHFADWLHFEMDQARDAMIVRNAAVGGIGNLPLLGPRAAGTFLRLGPAYYNFQYLAAKITGSVAPQVMAYPEALFSILAVPLFFLFLRLRFSKLTSLLVTTLYAFSFTVVQYGRFAWNPNAVPFWMLLSLYSLVKATDSEGNKKYVWYGLAAFALGIASQLHFLVFLSLPIIIILYLFWSGRYKKINLKIVALVLAILLLLYLPVIISDVVTKGSNVIQFIGAVKSKPSDSTFATKFVADVLVHGKYYVYILTSYISPESGNSDKIGTLFIILSLFYIVFQMRKTKEEKNKSFLKLMLIWFGISFLLLLSFSEDIRPRFFFGTLFLPFIFLAFWIEWLIRSPKRKYLNITAAVIFIAAAIALNVEGIRAGFVGASRDVEPQPWGDRPLIVNEVERVPLYQLQNATEFLYERGKSENKTVKIHGNMTYRVPLQYLLDEKKPPFNYAIFSKNDQEQGVLYFDVVAGDSKCKRSTDLLKGSELVGKFVAGHRFTICELALTNVASEPEDDQQQIEVVKEDEAPMPDNQNELIDDATKRAKTRIMWKDIFN